MLEKKDAIVLPLTLPDGRCSSIRNFGEQDLPYILDIETQTNLMPWSRQNFLDSLERSHICVGVALNSSERRIDGVVTWLAFAIFSIAADEAEVLLIATDPGEQRKGIASALLESMTSYLSERANQLFLEVRESNHSAIEFYEELGFHCLGERKNYYPVPKNRKIENKGANRMASTAQSGATRENALIYGKSIGEDFSFS